MTGRSLPRNQRLVFDALREAGKPLSAYEILDLLRPLGISAPPTVYRALRWLIERGEVHRVESLNAFVACSHSHDAGEAVLFMICDDCGSIREVSDSSVAQRLRRRAWNCNFDSRSATVELHGQCAVCSDP